LASSLHAQNKLLSLTTPPLFDPAIGKKGYWVYSWPDLGSVIDRLRIMTYDYSTSTPGPIGPITWVEQTVQWAVKTVPASKVFIGLPGYGRDWIVAVDGICPSKPINYLGTIKTTASAGTFVMRDAAGLATTYGAIPSYQAKYGETTFTYKKQYDGTTADGQLTTCTATRTVWYQDAQGFGLRANLVAKYRLGGLTQWTLGMEDPAATEAIRVVAKSIAPDVVLAALVSNASATVYGGTTTINGTFTLPDKRPLADLPVRVEIKTATSDWVPLFSGKTNVNGLISAQVILGENTKARMISEGTWERAEGRSPELSIQVARKLSWIKVPTSMKRGTSYTLTAKIQPKIAGVTVTLNNGASGVSDANGEVSFTVSEKVTGFKRYQLTAQSDAKNLASTSEVVTVLVR
jgi:hypothetical protein